MKNLAGALFASAVLMTSVARAEDAKPKRVTLSAGAFYGFPAGDFKSAGGTDIVGSSPGLMLAGGYQIISGLSAMAMLHYYFVSSEIDGEDLSMWDIGIGLRYVHPVTPLVGIYGEGYAQRASFSADPGGSASGFGFYFGAGAAYTLTQNIQLLGGLSYSSASLEPDQGDSVSGGWIGFTAAAAYRL